LFVPNSNYLQLYQAVFIQIIKHYILFLSKHFLCAYNSLYAKKISKEIQEVEDLKNVYKISIQSKLQRINDKYSISFK